LAAEWPLAPLPRPGLGITAVTRCIWFGGLPPNILEADLAREASKVGDVQFIVFLECPNRDEALVTFATFKCDQGSNILPTNLMLHATAMPLSAWQQ
jgi:hypothetical protein